MGHSRLMKEAPQTRQDQILQAAAKCFVEDGFHGAGMARIAKTAQMSPGHIYHYFESKEAIIAEIVRREEDGAREFLSSFDGLDGEAMISALVDCVSEGIANSTDSFHSVLMLEILAEAMRNDGIAHIVCETDRQLREEFARVLERSLGIEDALLRVEALFTVFSGLAIRSIRNPQLDREALTPLVQSIIRHLIG